MLTAWTFRNRASDPAGSSLAEAPRAMAALVPGVVISALVSGVVLPMLPVIALDRGTSLAMLGVILAATRVSRMVAAPFAGIAVDRWGSRALVLFGFAIQLGALALYALGIAGDRVALCFVAGRGLQGIGAACVAIAAQTFALEGSDAHRKRSVDASLIRASSGVGLPGGLVIGALVADTVREVHVIAFATGALALATLMTFAFGPRTRSGQRRAGRTLTSDVERERSDGCGSVDGYLVRLGALNFAVSFFALGLVLTTIIVSIEQSGASFATFGAIRSRGVASGLLGAMVLVMSAASVVVARTMKSARHAARIAVAATLGLAPAMLAVAVARTFTGAALGLALIGVASGALSAAITSLLGAFGSSSRRGGAVGWMQFSSDLGGSLGPLVAVALIGAGVVWEAGAALVVCFIPLAVFIDRHHRTSFASTP